MSLLVHDITIVHRLGAQYQVPDTLSRAFEFYVCAAVDKPIVDNWYIRQVAKVQKNPERFPDWKFENGRLFFHKPNSWVDPLLTDTDAWKLVIPAEYRTRILQEVHDTPTAGHFGNFKTYTLLCRHYYWHGMRVDCARFVQTCQQCQ